MSLLNKDFIRTVLNHSAHWATSHASDEHEYLGAGLFYYSLVYMLRAKLCVCLGSGGGFVPRIMRQAQRDLGLDGARTILVDGNTGEWGRPQWLDEDSFFRRNFPDVEVILSQTHAVALDQARDWRIDYLHIDADHSHQGSLLDFQDYKNMMAPNGVITFHDTYGELPCVKTLDDVRAEGHSVINFPWIGGGFAMIQLKPRADVPTEWKYLQSEVFQSRYAIAAHALRDSKKIVEIGGYRTPIDQFIRAKDVSILVVDPTVEPLVTKRVRRVACDYRDFDYSSYTQEPYSLVLLGFDLPLSQTLFDLAQGADRTIVEFPEESSWTQSRTAFEELIAKTGLRIKQRMQLDLSGNDYGDLTNSWPPRTNRVLYVLTR